MRRSQKEGFTAVELIVIVTVVGLIFIVLLPYYLESLQKAKQRKTMANVNSIGKAMMNWMTDQAGAAAAGASATDKMVMSNFKMISHGDLDAIMARSIWPAFPKTMVGEVLSSTT